MSTDSRQIPPDLRYRNVNDGHSADYFGYALWFVVGALCAAGALVVLR